VSVVRLGISGLHLTRNQVERLRGLDTVTCDAILDALVRSKLLSRTQNDGYA